MAKNLHDTDYFCFSIDERDRVLSQMKLKLRHF